MPEEGKRHKAWEKRRKTEENSHAKAIKWGAGMGEEDKNNANEGENAHA